MNAQPKAYKIKQALIRGITVLDLHTREKRASRSAMRNGNTGAVSTHKLNDYECVFLKLEVQKRFD